MLSRPDDSCQRSAAGGLRRGVWVKIPLWGAYFRKRSSKGQRYRGAEALGFVGATSPSVDAGSRASTLISKDAGLGVAVVYVSER
jgi:hypothetical protein